MQLSPEDRLELVVDIPSEASEDEQENIEPMDATPSGRKRPRPHTESEEDSDSEIGVRKVSGVELLNTLPCSQPGTLPEPSRPTKEGSCHVLCRAEKGKEESEEGTGLQWIR